MNKIYLVLMCFLLALPAVGQVRKRVPLKESIDTSLINLKLLQPKQEILQKFGPGKDSGFIIHGKHISSRRVEYTYGGYEGFLFLYFDSLDRNISFSLFTAPYSQENHNNFNDQLKKLYGAPAISKEMPIRIWEQPEIVYFLSHNSHGVSFGKWLSYWYDQIE